MPVALTYTTLQTALLQLTVKSQPPYTTIPPDFAQVYPQAINYAEARIYRDLVLLATREADTSVVTTDSRQYSLSAMTNPIIVLEGVALLTPAGQTTGATATRVPYDRASLDVIDQIWPVEATTVAPSITDWNPRYWAQKDASNVVLCPTPGAGYTIENTGLFQPAPLSVSNTTTYLSTVYPELLETACMVFLTGGLLHNWGAQSDDPRSGLSWSQQYEILKNSALAEEMRRRGLAPDVAQPPRAA